MTIKNNKKTNEDLEKITNFHVDLSNKSFNMIEKELTKNSTNYLDYEYKIRVDSIKKIFRYVVKLNSKKYECLSTEKLKDYAKIIENLTPDVKEYFLKKEYAHVLGLVSASTAFNKKLIEKELINWQCNPLNIQEISDLCSTTGNKLKEKIHNKQFLINLVETLDNKKGSLTANIIEANKIIKNNGLSPFESISVQTGCYYSEDMLDLNNLEKLVSANYEKTNYGARTSITLKKGENRREKQKVKVNSNMICNDIFLD